MKLNFLFLLIFIFSCTPKQNTRNDKIDPVNTSMSLQALPDSLKPNTEIIETFIDSIHIGEKGENKIEIIKHRVYEDNYVIIRFYTKGHNYWYIQNTYLYECDALMSLDPNIADFNNDKFNDVTFISGTAARGANEIRRLFVYDGNDKKLISIVNSHDFPNMLYNKELDCIDAFRVYGGSSTVFARIVGDSLKEFAGVHSSEDSRTVYEVDQFGNEKLIRKDPILNNENIFARYINYKPLKEY